MIPVAAVLAALGLLAILGQGGDGLGLPALMLTAGSWLVMPPISASRSRALAVDQGGPPGRPRGLAAKRLGPPKRETTSPLGLGVEFSVNDEVSPR